MSTRSELPAKGQRRRADTKKLILDAAEELFSRKGFDGVAVREITQLADVNLALATYHFQTKENLFDQVIARRADALGKRRRESLAIARERGDLTIESILAAFIDPYRDVCVSNDPGWRYYSIVIAQTAQSPQWCHITEKHFDPVVRLFVDSIQEVVPEAPRSNIVNAFVFSIAIMINTFAGSRRIESLLGAKSESVDILALYPSMMKFIASGFRAIVDGDAAPSSMGEMQVRQLVAENEMLRRLVADLTLERAKLQDMLKVRS